MMYPHWQRSSPTAWFVDLPGNDTGEVVVKERATFWTGYLNAKPVVRRKDRRDAQIAVLMRYIARKDEGNSDES